MKTSDSGRAGGMPSHAQSRSENDTPEHRAQRDVEERWFNSYLPNNMSGGGTQPLIPIFMAEGLGSNVAQVSLVTAATSVASVPSAVGWGNISDRMGKRKAFVILGFLGMGISFILMGICQTLEQYLFANLLMGLLATASGPIAIVLIIETSSEPEWAGKIGRFSRIGGWGWVFGLVIGVAWLSIPGNAHNVDAMRGMFVISAALSFLSACMAWVWIDEPPAGRMKVPRDLRVRTLAHVSLRHTEKSHFLPQRLLHIPGKGMFDRLRAHGFHAGHELVFFFVAAFIFTAAFVMFYTIFPIYLYSRLAMSAGEVFAIYMSSSVASALMYAYAGGLVQKRSSKGVLSVAVAARIFLIPAFLLLLMLPNSSHMLTFALVVLLQALMGFCWAMIAVAGTTMASELAPVNARGESLGLFTAVQGVASIAGALVGGAAAFWLGWTWAIIIPAGLAGAAALMLVKVKLISQKADTVTGQEKGRSQPD